MKHIKAFDGLIKLTPDELSNEISNCIRYDENVYNVDELINAGANLNYKDVYGDSLLILAVKHEDYDTAKKLINAGCDINAVNNNGNTALMWATLYTVDMVKLLIDSNANLTFLSKGGHHAFIFYAKNKVKEWLNTYEAQDYILSKEPSLYKYFKEYGIKILPKIKKKYGFANAGTELDLL